jgi:hypothetical protein
MVAGSLFGKENSAMANLIWLAIDIRIYSAI